MRFFLTKIRHRHPDGHDYLFASRAHRKGLLPARILESGLLEFQPLQSRPWFRFWAPQRLTWWIAILFMIGSSFFAFASFAANWPSRLPPLFSDPHINPILFFIGSIFFTLAAGTQLLEAINGDIADIDLTQNRKQPWRWFAWKPKNAGYMASLLQFIGTLYFNFNTGNALISGLNGLQQDLLIWMPNMIGSIFFLLSSYIALIEISHRFFSFQPQHISWWISMLNMVGSIAFMISAFDAFVSPKTGKMQSEWGANFYTLLGVICFFIAAYLMIPELFGAGQKTKMEVPTHE